MDADYGIMDRRRVIGGMINSISRLIHLVACQTRKTAATADFRCMVGMLKRLKCILDEAFGSSFPWDDHQQQQQLVKALEELDLTVNEAREFLEKDPQRLSKLYTVLQSGQMVLGVHKSSLRICQILNELLHLSSFPSYLATTQHCMQELECVEWDPTPELVAIVLKDLKENLIPRLDDIIKIVETLGLASSEELLTESISLEQERLRLELKGKAEDADKLTEMIGLVAHIRCCVARLKQYGYAVNGFPIPSHFRCPLSLRLMLDPVIIASGLTFERSFIQRWLNNGLTICPTTRQTLAHTNLIPNYTVKALIACWCEEHNLNLLHKSEEATTNPFLTNPSPNRDRNRSPAEYLNQSGPKMNEISSAYEEQGEGGGYSLERRSFHSPTESNSSVISSIDIISSKFDDKVSLEGSCPPSPFSKDVGPSPSPSPLSFGTRSVGHENKFQSSGSDDSTTTSSHVEKLVQDLKCHQSPEKQTAAASELRHLAKNNMENRVLIARCRAIPPLILLLHSRVKTVQESAVTTLLNLSINDGNKSKIAEGGAIQPLIDVLECGTPMAKENAAATLFSLSLVEEYRAKIGSSGAIRALISLLGTGSLRGRKDAATALFNLSIYHENKARIVQAGGVRHLVELMMEPSTGMVDKCVALLANLSSIQEGRVAIVQEGGIPLLVEAVEMGSPRGKENAASILLQLCINSNRFCSLVLQEGAVPPLIALSQFGTPRAKDKAQQILSHFRSQRETMVRRSNK